MNIQNDDDSKRFVVYCHTNLINSKKYIGITCQPLAQRWRNGKGYKSSPHFNNAIQKYGWDNFSHEVLFEDLSQSEAEEKEIELIKKYNTRNRKYGYNIAAGGGVMCGENNPMYGKKLTPEQRRKIGEASKGRKHTEEFKKYMSQKFKGRVFSEETRRKMSENHADVSGEKNHFYGRKLTQEQIDKLVKASKTPEAIAKMKKNKIWYSCAENPNAKTVMCIETGKIYSTIKEAAEDTGCIASKISAVCHGHIKHTKNLTFKIIKKEKEKND